MDEKLDDFNFNFDDADDVIGNIMPLRTFADGVDGATSTTTDMNTTNANNNNNNNPTGPGDSAATPLRSASFVSSASSAGSGINNTNNNNSINHKRRHSSERRNESTIISDDTTSGNAIFDGNADGFDVKNSPFGESFWGNKNNNNNNYYYGNGQQQGSNFDVMQQRNTKIRHLSDSLNSSTSSAIMNSATSGVGGIGGGNLHNSNSNNFFSSRNSQRSTGNSQKTLSSLTSLSERLGQLSMRDREKAEFDMHGIPLDDEYFDGNIHIQKNERDPAKMKQLLQELDMIVDQKLNNKQQQNCNNNIDSISSSSGKSSAPFSKKTLSPDDAKYGMGLKLARKQDPQYVHEQRIKFLRADRYDTQLAAERMIRFFDLKLNLFCSDEYNFHGSNNNCLGRDLRWADFSKSDLLLWKASGFLQLCGTRDRAKRTIIIIFGKAILEYQIPVDLVLRAYLYVSNIWSRDVSIQKAGYVVVAYCALTPVNNSSSNSNDDFDEGIVDDYLKIMGPLNERVHMCGQSSHLRGVARHFCYDHPKLHDQFEDLGETMSGYHASRFRCHYAQNHFKPTSKYNQHQELLYTLMTFGIPRDTIPIDEKTGEINLEYNVAILDAIQEREKQDLLMEQKQQQQQLENQMQQQPQLENQQQQQQQQVQHERKEQDQGEIVPLKDGSGGGRTESDTNTTSSSKDALWMSLSASVVSASAMTDSFSLFPDILEDDDVANLVKKIEEDDDSNIDRGGRVVDSNSSSSNSNGYDNSNPTNTLSGNDLFAAFEEENSNNNNGGYGEQQQGQQFFPSTSLSSFPQAVPEQEQYQEQYQPQQLPSYVDSSSTSFQQQQQQQQQPFISSASSQQRQYQQQPQWTSSYSSQQQQQHQQPQWTSSYSSQQPQQQQPQWPSSLSSQQQPFASSLSSQQQQQRFDNTLPEKATSSIGDRFAAMECTFTTTSAVTTSARSNINGSGGETTTMKANPYDIIMGRGQWNKIHPGNIRFKNILARDRDKYDAANRFERMRIVDAMLDELFVPQALPPGTGVMDSAAAASPRFLYKEKSTTPAADAAAGGGKTRNKRGSKNNEDLLQGPWLIASRERAHDKITHDFRNMRRQKQPLK